MPGTEITIIKNSSVGNFAVLICSDYLDGDVRHRLLSEDLDILCVPAFQKTSAMYHDRMSLDCEENEAGLYIGYSNMFCDGFGDGRSAIFGVMDSLFTDKLKQSGFTDLDPMCKVCELRHGTEYMLVEFDIQQKKPFAKRTVRSRSNIRLVAVTPESDEETLAFAKKIAHDDERYRRIKELFVAPKEFSAISEKLENARMVFIVGDPGIGKTYTAANLLRLYFDKGFEPVWYTGLEKAERMIQRQILENFRPKERQIIYFEDPFGRTTF